MATSLSESCEATLTIGRRKYYGSTGMTHGHAEMDALHQFIEAEGGAANAAVMLSGPFRKLVLCPSRAVCLKCTAVLQQLDFKLEGDTEWGDRTAGKTEWGVSLQVQDLFRRLEIDYESIKSLKNQ